LTCLPQDFVLTGNLSNNFALIELEVAGL